MHHAPTQLLTFAIGYQRFGIDAGCVAEVIRAVQLARLPNAPRVVEGLMDLRGTVVPVLDIRWRFGLSPKPLAPEDHIVVAHAKDRTVGLRTDRAIGVLALPEDDVVEIAALTSEADYISGVAKLPDGLLFIHDLATFLSDAEAQSIDDAVGELA